MLTGKKLAQGLHFRVPKPSEPGFDEAKQWIELLRDGTFSAGTLAETPLSYQTRPEWETALLKSGESHGYTWLHRLHLDAGAMIIMMIMMIMVIIQVRFSQP